MISIRADSKIVMWAGALCLALVGCASSPVDPGASQDNAAFALPEIEVPPASELVGEYVAHAFPRAITAETPAFRVSRSGLVTAMAFSNRGGGHAYLFANAFLRDALDASEEVWISYRGVHDGDAVAVVRGIPQAALRRVFDMDDDGSHNTFVFREATRTDLSDGLAHADEDAAKRPLHLVNNLGQSIFVREDGTWILGSREGRSRATALARATFAAGKPGATLAWGRAESAMLRDHFTQLDTLGLSPRVGVVALVAPRTWVLGAQIEGDTDGARRACDAVVASFRNDDDPNDDLGGTRRCAVRGDEVLARVRLPEARFSYGLRIEKRDGKTTVSPNQAPLPPHPDTKL